jgi:hypothetical protein
MTFEKNVFKIRDVLHLVIFPCFSSYELNPHLLESIHLIPYLLTDVFIEFESKMTTTIIVNSPSDDDIKSQIEHRHFLHPPTLNTKPTIFKPFPQSIIQSIENNRKHPLTHDHSTLNVYDINQSSIDTTDDDDYETTTTTTTSSRKHSLNIPCSERSPSEIRINIHPDVAHEPLTTSPFPISTKRRNSDVTFSGLKTKQTRVDYLRRAFLEHSFGRRINPSFSSTSTIRSNNRRRSTQTFPQRFYRRQPYTLPRNSHWHFVRNHLHDIAMMNESYARMKLIERDLRWIHLREEICRRVLDMREMSLLRQQDDGKLKASAKKNFDLKAIPINEVVHVERDGRVYSIGTRDLVLGRLISDEDLQLDTFAQLEARRRVVVKQDLLRQQEGRTRLKKHIAFSFCLCNLSFIVLMFAAMFICVMKTIIELKSRQVF